MCGIAGAFTLGGRRPLEPQRVARMSAALAHRGPDGEGSFHRPGVAFGHRRLAIVDVAGGAQPMESEDGSIAVVSNGEIYNHVAIRRELEPRGHRYRTRSDTEAIVHGYAAWGAQCASHFEGKFAFAVYEARADTLLVVRDRLAVKPLYYTVTRLDGDACFLFASEIKGILAFGDVPRVLDTEAIEDSLLVGFILGERTAYKDIRRLEGGTSLTVTREGIRSRRYWDLRFEASPSANPDELARTLATSVADRLMSDVPIAACLSGGLDSSLIVALAQRASVAPLCTLAVGFDGSGAPTDERVVEGMLGDDLFWAREVAASLGTDHIELLLPRGEYLPGLDEAIAHREKPLLSPAEYGLLRVARATKPIASVLLSGQGADEIFGGYYYWTHRRSPENTPFFPWVFRPFGPGRYEGAHAAAEIFACLLGEARAARAWERLKDEWTAWQARAAAPTFEQTLTYVMVKLHLAEQLEHEDALKMAHGVELRVPFVDHRVVELAANVPPLSPDAGTLEKPLLRQIGRALLPAAVTARKKSPFPHPIGLVEEERAMAEVLGGAAIDVVLDPAVVKRFLGDYERPGSYAKRRVLFKCYTLARFLELGRCAP